MSRPAYIFLALTSSLWAVRAEAAKVVIVRSANASPALDETLSRLQGELLSLGLEVAITERPTAPGANEVDARAWMERTATEHETDAVIQVIGDTGPLAVDIWVEQRPGRSLLTHLTLEPNAENAPERLAIRAVEVLRSSLVEFDLAAKGRQEATVSRAPPVIVTQSPPRASEAAAPVDLQVGAALFTSLDGVGPALMPIVRVGWSPRSFIPPWLVLQAAFAGFGSRPTVTAEGGSARVAQQYGVLGACLCARSARALAPHVALLAGGLRAAIDGQADSPGEAHSVLRWSFVVDASVGARLRLPGRYHLTLAAHVQVAQPYVAIHFVDTLVATSGRPNLGLSLTVGAWL